MAIRTIAVFLDGTPAGDARLASACRLASQHGAHLVAVGVTLAPDMARYAMPGAEMAVDFAAIDAARDRAKEISAAASAVMEKEGLGSDSRWASSIGPGLTEIVGRIARHSDVTLVGPLSDDAVGDLADAVLDGTLFESGRPTIVVPAMWEGDMGARIMVGWDASRAASRAIADAAPFIERAEETRVVVVDPTPGEGGFGEEPGADIAAVIARQGSSVSLDRIPRAGASVTQRLLTHAVDIGADMMVLGGYGHSRLGEALLGGVTHEILRTVNTPALLSR